MEHGSARDGSESVERGEGGGPVGLGLHHMTLHVGGVTQAAWALAMRPKREFYVGCEPRQSLHQGRRVVTDPAGAVPHVPGVDHHFHQARFGIAKGRAQVLVSLRGAGRRSKGRGRISCDPACYRGRTAQIGTTEAIFGACTYVVLFRRQGKSAKSGPWTSANSPASLFVA